jgi:hypothetical protein
MPDVPTIASTDRRPAQLFPLTTRAPKWPDAARPAFGNGRSPLVLSLHCDSDIGRLSWARIVKNATTNGNDDHDEEDASTLGCEIRWSTILPEEPHADGPISSSNHLFVHLPHAIRREILCVLVQTQNNEEDRATTMIDNDVLCQLLL